MLNLLGKDSAVWQLPTLNGTTVKLSNNPLGYIRIFVYNVCLNSISYTISNGVAKALLLNMEMAHLD